MEKVLIIKLGYSETLDKEISEVSSLGDVLRTTVVLHKYKNANVTWLVDRKAFPLLIHNRFIKRVLPYDMTTVLQLQREKFDTIINFEKVPGICALADSINAWRRYGFRFDEIKGEAAAYDNSQEILGISRNEIFKKKNIKSLQQVIIELIGEKWNAQEYMLGYTPDTKVKYDVGFNWNVGVKWPTKEWPKENWSKLESLIANKYSVSWQQGLKNIEEYVEWINSCKILITSDSLGLHVALALKKKVIALFGPTVPAEIFFYNRGVVLTPKIKYDCIPCISSICSQKIHCMNFIQPETVAKEIKNLMLSFNKLGKRKK